MTLKELAEAVSAAQGWKLSAKGGAFVLTLAVGEGRSQSVTLGAFQHDSAPMVRITTPVGSASGLDAARCRTALQLNGRFPAGCLAIEGDLLVMTETHPLATTTPESSARAIRFLAGQADLYEQHIYGTDKH